MFLGRLTVLSSHLLLWQTWTWWLGSELFQSTQCSPLALGGPQRLHQPDDLACTVVQLFLRYGTSGCVHFSWMHRPGYTPDACIFLSYIPAMTGHLCNKETLDKWESEETDEQLWKERKMAKLAQRAYLVRTYTHLIHIVSPSERRPPWVSQHTNLQFPSETRKLQILSKFVKTSSFS